MNIMKVISAIVACSMLGPMFFSIGETRPGYQITPVFFLLSTCLFVGIWLLGYLSRVDE